jgi:hypothetical protein
MAYNPRDDPLNEGIPPPPPPMRPNKRESSHWFVHRLISRKPVPYGQGNAKEQEMYDDEAEYERRVQLYYERQREKRGAREAAMEPVGRDGAVYEVIAPPLHPRPE